MKTKGITNAKSRVAEMQGCVMGKGTPGTSAFLTWVVTPHFGALQKLMIRSAVYWTSECLVELNSYKYKLEVF